MSEPKILVRQPGVTDPSLYTSYVADRGASTAGWSVAFKLREQDGDAVAALSLTGVVSRVALDDLDDVLKQQITSYYAKKRVAPPTHLWKVLVTNTTAETQDLRGPYEFGCDLNGPASANVSAGVGVMDFGSDPAR